MAPAPAAAEDLFRKIEHAPASEVWLDSGFATFHVDDDKGLNGRNPGAGLEYRFSSTMSATAGRFLNSDNDHTVYAGVIYQPYQIGPVRLGAVFAALNGYPKMRDGGWFPALIPTATIEYKRVGVNLAFVPGYKDKLHAGVSVQLKFRVW
ncbi:hypothetical protein C7C56_017180 [Massilia glaciei]|uniref:Uncharacterized protein n=1 Tax=Massilia glaciei TaxID=1524097 RepID=A0A2U2HI15_9BURK|nr:hypothetical protein C7C56_017180 [Massilia glaciei]